ncbi:MAG: hypothetical protein JNM00_08350 [Flavobacteriales bacterium]|nr:hypothetical protein [Flavobacteriales bacterium]
MAKKLFIPKPNLGIGEANTASNVGASGTGIFDGKVGVDLQFRKLAAGSSKLTVTLDGQVVEVDLGAVAIADITDLQTELDSLATQIADGIAGLAWKDSARVATTANITLSGEQTIDGVSVVAGDRVLVKNQSTASENGVYVCAVGAWSRSTDANSAAELEGATITAQEGSTNANTTWTQTADSITIGVTSISWSQLGASVPAASESTAGIAEIATQGEVDAETDTSRIVVPATLGERLKGLCIFAQTADGTVQNTTSETTLFGTGEGSLTIPADFFKVGRTLKVTMMGIITNTGSPTIRLRVKLGGSTIIDTTAVTMGTITGTQFFIAEFLITCRTAGSSGTVIGQGMFNYWASTSSQRTATGASSGTVTVNTTGTLALDVTVQWGTASASNRISSHNAIVERVR